MANLFFVLYSCMLLFEYRLSATYQLLLFMFVYSLSVSYTAELGKATSLIPFFINNKYQWLVYSWVFFQSDFSVCQKTHKWGKQIFQWVVGLAKEPVAAVMVKQALLLLPNLKGHNGLFKLCDKLTQNLNQLINLLLSLNLGKMYVFIYLILLVNNLSEEVSRRVRKWCSWSVVCLGRSLSLAPLDPQMYSNSLLKLYIYINYFLYCYIITLTCTNIACFKSQSGRSTLCYANWTRNSAFFSYFCCFTDKQLQFGHVTCFPKRDKRGCFEQYLPFWTRRLECKYQVWLSTRVSVHL